MAKAVKIIITGDASDARKAFGDVEESSSKMSRTLAGAATAVGGAFAVDKIIDFGGQLLNTSAQLASIDTKVKTVFEGQAATIRAWADKNNEAFGLTDDQLAGLAANFGDLLKPMGFTADQAASMSKDVIGLAGALSSWTGGTKSAAEVSSILAKAMLGERDGLKELGISISEADVQAKLAAKGQDNLTGAALEQAKAIATQELIFEKSADAQKAWAAGGNEALKSSNKVKASMAELQETLALKLGPIIQKVVGWFGDNMPTAIAFAEAAFNKIVPVVAGIASKITALTGFLMDHKEILIGVGVAIATLLIPPLVAWAVAAATAAAATIAGTLPVIALGVAIAGLVAGIIWVVQNFDIFKDAALTVFDAVTGAASTAIGWITDNWPLLLAILTGPFGLAVKGIADHWDTILTFIKELPGKIRDAAAGMWDGIGDAFKVAINALIGMWNNLAFPSFEIGGWDTPFGEAPSFHTPKIQFPQIPYLAEGGIVTRPTLAMLGESGREAVIPLGRGGYGAGNNYTINQYIAPGADKAAIGQATVEAIVAYERNNGKGWRG